MKKLLRCGIMIAMSSAIVIAAEKKDSRHDFLYTVASELRFIKHLVDKAESHLQSCNTVCTSNKNYSKLLHDFHTLEKNKLLQGALRRQDELIKTIYRFIKNNPSAQEEANFSSLITQLIASQHALQKELAPYTSKL